MKIVKEKRVEEIESDLDQRAVESLKPLHIGTLSAAEFLISSATA